MVLAELTAPVRRGGVTQLRRRGNPEALLCGCGIDVVDDLTDLGPCGSADVRGQRTARTGGRPRRRPQARSGATSRGVRSSLDSRDPCTRCVARGRSHDEHRPAPAITHERTAGNCKIVRQTRNLSRTVHHEFATHVVPFAVIRGGVGRTVQVSRECPSSLPGQGAILRTTGAVWVRTAELPLPCGGASQRRSSISVFRQCSTMVPLDAERDDLLAMCPER